MNVPHELSDAMAEEIRKRGITVCPTLAGSAYSVLKLLRAPVRRDLYMALRLLRLPGVARVLLRQEEPMRRWEEWLAGLPNEAILRMATVDAAAALGIQQSVGTIEPGKRADLALVDGDPLADIEALGRVSMVVKEGRVVYRKGT